MRKSGFCPATSAYFGCVGVEVKFDGSSLRHFAKEVMEDKEVVKLAVSQYPDALAAWSRRSDGGKEVEKRPKQGLDF